MSVGVFGGRPSDKKNQLDFGTESGSRFGFRIDFSSFSFPSWRDRVFGIKYELKELWMSVYDILYRPLWVNK